MSWTDERIDLLQKLWGDGLSASQIATQLGGVTRNAVIGKVHRLGLSDKSRMKTRNHRPGPNATVPATAPNPAPALQTADPVESTVHKIDDARAERASRTAEAAPVVEPVAAQPKAATPLQGDTGRPSPVLPVKNAPPKGSVGILELNDQTCRWPFGDPAKPGFHFCGAHCSVGDIYCSEHAKVAYQPVEARRRR